MCVESKRRGSPRLLSFPQRGGERAVGRLVAKVAVSKAVYAIDKPYDYLVINDKVSGAVEEIEAILTAAECRVENRKTMLSQFI